MSLERRAGPERDHRHDVLGADGDDALHVLGALGKDHRIRRLVVVPRGRVTVLLAHGLRGDEPIPELRCKLGDGASDRLRVLAFRA